MKVLFRLEAGFKVGLGHYIRCLAIAEILRNKHEATVILATSDSSRSLFDKWRKLGNVVSIPANSDDDECLLAIVEEQRPDVIVIDRLVEYRESLIRELNSIVPVVMIHGIGDAVFKTSAVIYPNAHMSGNLLSDARWVTGETRMFSGWDYVILNEIVIPHQNSAKPIHPPRRINLITGGSDPAGVLLKLMPILGEADLGIPVHGLIGSSYQDRMRLEDAISSYSSELCLTNYNIDEVLYGDLTICTFGVTVYELIFLGLPIITLGHAESNALGSKRLAERYHINQDLGLLSDLDESEFIKKIRDAIKEKHQDMFMNVIHGKSFLDGKGAERCAGEINKYDSCKVN
jgi:spore coat polysaccharide biosynthesis predicted glycosyltransferase SpsG